MLTLLVIIAVIASFLAICYYTWKHVKDTYQYNIFSVGGMVLSFVGMVASLMAYNYFKYGLYVERGYIAVAVIVVTYGFMLYWDRKKTSITIAIVAMFLRYMICLLIAILILFCATKGNSDSSAKERLKSLANEL